MKAASTILCCGASSTNSTSANRCSFTQRRRGEFRQSRSSPSFDTLVEVTIHGVSHRAQDYRCSHHCCASESAYGSTCVYASTRHNRNFAHHALRGQHPEVSAVLRGFAWMGSGPFHSS